MFGVPFYISSFLYHFHSLFLACLLVFFPLAATLRVEEEVSKQREVRLPPFEPIKIPTSFTHTNSDFVFYHLDSSFKQVFTTLVPKVITNPTCVLPPAGRFR